MSERPLPYLSTNLNPNLNVKPCAIDNSSDPTQINIYLNWFDRIEEALSTGPGR